MDTNDILNSPEMKELMDKAKRLMIMAVVKTPNSSIMLEKIHRNRCMSFLKCSMIMTLRPMW